MVWRLFGLRNGLFACSAGKRAGPAALTRNKTFLIAANLHEFLLMFFGMWY
jgi:hypothetical protein